MEHPLAFLRQMPGPRFKVGDVVAVLDLEKAGYVRIPADVHEKVAKVVQSCGRDLDPQCAA